jgi:hypothetical protein
MSLSSSFWGFVETVKQKSEEIVSIYKEDLSEFSKTIVQDTTTVVQERLADLQLDARSNKKGSKSASKNQNQYQVRVSLLQKDSHTYTDAPSDTAFTEWASSFNIGAYTEAITHLLTTNESVREFHTLLVPAQVSYRDFWCRYYYRSHKLEQEEIRRAALVKSTIESSEDEDFNWDYEDESKSSERVESAGKLDASNGENNGIVRKSDVEQQHLPSQGNQDQVEGQELGQEQDKQERPGGEQDSVSSQHTSVELSTTPGEVAVAKCDSAAGSEKAVVQERDDIDREIEQKYLQIQNNSGERKLSQSDEDEWGTWE